MKDERDASWKAAPTSPFIIHNSSLQYPARLRQRLGPAAPPELTALGNPNILSQPMTALFCSARCPGKLILRTYDQVAQRIRQFSDIGIELFMLQFQPFEAEMARFAEHIIPRFRGDHYA